MPKPIPDGFHTLTPHIVAKGAANAIDFYKKAFGAEELFRMPGPDGKSLMHAEIRIGDSIVMLIDECPEWGLLSPLSLKGSPVTLHLYVQDVDAGFKRAVDVGATVKSPPQDMFWGDRYAQVTDPFGHIWSIATHKEDLSPEEIGRRAEKAFAEIPKP